MKIIRGAIDIHLLIAFFIPNLSIIPIFNKFI